MELYGTKKYKELKYQEATHIKNRSIKDIISRTRIAFLDWKERNRIESNIEKIEIMMNICGYDSVKISLKTDWKKTDDYNIEELTKFLNTFAKLNESYTKNFEKLYPDDFKINFQYVNKWEKITDFLQKEMRKIAHQWRYCGMVKCGEGGGLLGI